MGLTKQYLRYVAGEVFGVIASGKCNAVYINYKKSNGRYIATGASEHVLILDSRTSECVERLSVDKLDCEVTRLQPCPDSVHLAVGYGDGSIRVFNMTTAECAVTFNGHGKSVTCLSYDQNGMRLASGSMDCEIVIWDIVNEAGLYRLKGHKGGVTQVRFASTHNYLLSSSKDNLVKFWDLDTQHCFHTITTHRSEVCDFLLVNEDTTLITGCFDSELRIWQLHHKKDENFEMGNVDETAKRLKTIDLEEDSTSDLIECVQEDSIIRKGKDRVLALRKEPGGTAFICHGPGQWVELFSIATPDELESRLKRKQKRLKKRAACAKDDDSDMLGFEPARLLTMDRIKKLAVVKMANKVKSVDLIRERNRLKICVQQANNLVETYLWDFDDPKIDSILAVSKIAHLGHRSDVRTLSFSSDNTAIMSGSSETLKIWNMSSRRCIRTFECDYALTGFFAPGDRHCLLGTKAGTFQIFDISSSRLLQSVEGHNGEIWSISPLPDKRGFASGGADKQVKFWTFEMAMNPDSDSQELTVFHARTLQLEEDVLAIKFSDNGKFIAVALLDSTVKIFFVDSLKFFLSLYGHKLPVLCMDISTDSTLIITGSADKNVKIWGMDFGDCHKSIFAHDDSIVTCAFIPNTHMFFTGGKDGRIKQWDADNFEKIISFKGHYGDVRALAISPNGRHVVTAGSDRAIRLWNKTEEILVLEEEREAEREAELERNPEMAQDRVMPGHSSEEVGLPSKSSIETVKAAEKLLEALEIHEQMQAKKPGATQDHVLFMAYNVESSIALVAVILSKIPSSELEKTLLILPFAQVVTLIKIIRDLVESATDIELYSRCLLFLLRVHHGQITSSRELLPIVDGLRILLAAKVKHSRDVIGTNLAGLNFLRGLVESRENVQLFADASDRLTERNKKRKRKQKAIQRAVLTL